MRTVLLLFAASVCSVLAGQGLYSATVVPRDYVPLCAPANTLKLPHWGSSSNSIQLIHIEPEGKRVARGDVVAQFRFRSERARDHLVSQHRQLKAERDEALLRLVRRVDELEYKRAEMEVACEKLKLSLLKSRTLSAIKVRLLEYDQKLQSLELETLERKVAAARQSLAWAKRHHGATIKAWEVYFDVFDTTKARYEVTAPDEGVLHYPILESRNRKVRKGDQMNSGVHFLSVVRSDEAEVRFFLPERAAHTVAVGDTVHVSALGQSEVRARVSKVSFFPITAGNAQRNYLLPNAWDKCFVVSAHIEGSFVVTAANGVKVRVGR